MPLKVIHNSTCGIIGPHHLKINSCFCGRNEQNKQSQMIMPGMKIVGLEDSSSSWSDPCV